MDLKNLDGYKIYYANTVGIAADTSTISNLESIKVAQFTPNEKCVLKPEPITLQCMISGF